MKGDIVQQCERCKFTKCRFQLDLSYVRKAVVMSSHKYYDIEIRRQGFCMSSNSSFMGRCLMKRSSLHSVLDTLLFC